MHDSLFFSYATQDFLQLRRYTYERLDGSIRAEERFAAIRSFSKQPVKDDLQTQANQHGSFVFMISTRAGGVGLNLVAADTVSFIGSTQQQMLLFLRISIFNWFHLVVSLYIVVVNLLACNWLKFSLQCIVKDIWTGVIYKSNFY